MKYFMLILITFGLCLFINPIYSLSEKTINHTISLPLSSHNIDDAKNNIYLLFNNTQVKMPFQSLSISFIPTFKNIFYLEDILKWFYLLDSKKG